MEMGVNFPFLLFMSSGDIYDNIHFTWKTLNSNAQTNWVHLESSSNLNKANNMHNVYLQTDINNVTYQHACINPKQHNNLHLNYRDKCCLEK